MTGLDEESSVLALNKLNETQGFIGKAGLEGRVGVFRFEKGGGNDVCGSRNSTCKEIEPRKGVLCWRRGEDFGMAGT